MLLLALYWRYEVVLLQVFVVWVVSRTVEEVVNTNARVVTEGCTHFTGVNDHYVLLESTYMESGLLSE